MKRRHVQHTYIHTLNSKGTKHGKLDFIVHLQAMLQPSLMSIILPIQNITSQRNQQVMAFP